MISKDMLVIQLLEEAGEAKQEAVAEVLMNSGMHCLGCVLAHGETLEQAAAVHGIDVDKLIEELNKVIEK